MKNAKNAQIVVREAIKNMPDTKTCSCSSALKHAIITSKDAITAEAKDRLGLLIGKYIT
jgi:5'-methylthioadenosine phosphorylase